MNRKFNGSFLWSFSCLIHVFKRLHTDSVSGAFAIFLEGCQFGKFESSFLLYLSVVLSADDLQPKFAAFDVITLGLRQLVSFESRLCFAAMEWRLFWLMAV